jgi:peptidoglycan/xylan/chitin deacetylase (PgdA/CDA1 family)
MHRRHIPWLVALLPAIALSAVILGGCGRLRARGQTPQPQPQTQAAPAATAPVTPVTIPIFCMHDVRADAKKTYEIGPKSLQAYVGYLHSAGFETVSLAQVDAYLNGQGTLPPKPVVLTFDDGYKSVLSAAKPILDKYGYTATVFLIAQSVGKGSGNLTWNDVRALRKADYEIGSHTLSHAYLTKRKPKETKDAFEKRIYTEISESKRTIEQNLGEQIAAIAYPYGLYDDFAMQTAQGEGYAVGCTIDRGPADNESSALRLPRLMVVNKTSLAAFKAMCGLKALHLSDIKPEIGAHVATRSASISFALPSGTSASQVRVDLAPGKIITKVAKGNVISLSVRLDPGAANVTVAGGGRIASWLVVCDGG